MDPKTGSRIDARDRVRDGDYVILQYGEGQYEKHRKILQVRSLRENCSDSTDVAPRAAQETLIRIGPRYVHPSVLIGLPWGVRLTHADSSDTAPETATEVDDNRVVLAVRTDSENVAVSMDDSPPIRINAAFGDFRNTPDIGDDRMNQTLSDAELAAYRERFRDQPQQYVSQLAKTSSTFRKRTTFAQSKYLERKTSRHVFSMRLVRPTICTLTETLHHKMEGKSLWMHPEALGFVLHQAAIWAGSKRVLILEELSDRMGLVTAACAHRMRFPGRVSSHDEGILLFVAGSTHSSGIGPAMAMLGSGRKPNRKETSTNGEASSVEATTSNPIRSGSDGRSTETTGLPAVHLVPLECLVSIPNQQSSGHWQPLSPEDNIQRAPLIPNRCQGFEQDGITNRVTFKTPQRCNNRADLGRKPPLSDSASAEEKTSRSRMTCGASVYDKRIPVSPSIIRSWLENADQGNEALIIAFKDQIPGHGDLTQVLRLLLPLLTPGHPFVVWSPWLQPLAQVHALMCATEGNRGVYPTSSGACADSTIECTTVSVGSADGKRGAVDGPLTQAGGSAAFDSDPQLDQSVLGEHNPGHAATNVLQQVAHVRLTEITTYGHQFVAERTHPWMSNTPPSGFVLSGFRVQF